NRKLRVSFRPQPEPTPGSQSVATMTPVRLKIDEVLTADRVCPQGCGQRGRPAGMQARPRPDRQTA
ncbi:hypothetical protein, partial [Citrobacter freundii]|uniref:hypothetical protein n=1 Tax=Citrobacter freundii TaxID=546 RepID=UPI0023AF8CCC